MRTGRVDWGVVVADALDRALASHGVSVALSPLAFSSRTFSAPLALALSLSSGLSAVLAAALVRVGDLAMEAAAGSAAVMAGESDATAAAMGADAEAAAGVVVVGVVEAGVDAATEGEGEGEAEVAAAEAAAAEAAATPGRAGLASGILSSAVAGVGMVMRCGLYLRRGRCKRSVKSEMEGRECESATAKRADGYES